ncbi:tail fiber assembly protein [Pantoea sp. CTOTU50773]|uniref:tail fiber assembly protein n=1 Tax=Pantoea sp. CTOTU50773 TaxID=2953853 RepID=UPI00391A192B
MMSEESGDKVLIDVKQPRSINPDVSVDVDISINGAEFIPFTAMPGDRAGRDIYLQAIGGEYGKITLSPGKDYLWSGGKWVINEITDPVAEAESAKQLRLSEATAAIAPLQDAVDLGIATDDEVEMLQAWKKYRVLLSRVNTSEPVWPELSDVA